mmetsp:Transcript_142392/g.318539  ORF Transcript_142392/g.318539 Transcript_142392/m.318539 type:complete len:87 (-) Transcript_142392:33-293(-)
MCSSMHSLMMVSDRNADGVLNSEEMDVLSDSVGFTLGPGDFMTCLAEATTCAEPTPAGPVIAIDRMMVLASFVMGGTPTTCGSCSF